LIKIAKPIKESDILLNYPNISDAQAESSYEYCIELQFINVEGFV